MRCCQTSHQSQEFFLAPGQVISFLSLGLSDYHMSLLLPKSFFQKIFCLLLACKLPGGFYWTGLCGVKSDYCLVFFTL